MDKQTLRYTYLTYFAGQYAQKEDMDYEALVEMAGDNYELCTEVISELLKEGLVEGIELIETKAGYAVGQYQGKLKLTAEGIKEILNLFPDEKKEIIDDIKSETKIKNTNTISIDSIHERLLQQIRRNSEFKSNKANTTKIRTIFNKTVGSRYKAEKAIAKLKTDGYINFLYNDDIASFCPNNLLTDKAIKFLDEVNEKRMLEAISNIRKPLPTTQEMLEEMGAPKKVYEYIKNVEERVKKEEEEKKRKNTSSITFEGILGRNCGTITQYYDSDIRLQEKGYVVEGGTYVLRGFAKMSDLVEASEVDQNNYQRIEDLQHIKDIKDFLQKGKVHFLPEVVLVARNDVEIQEIDFNLKGKQLGRFKNINYRKIIVAPKSLYRVDGNHRLEAYEESQKDYYIPFSIILWHVDEGLEKSQEQQEKQKKNDIDNEAFLFYLLNAKSKPLTLEDNIKGIVKSDVAVWKDENIRDVNFIFPHLRGIYNDLNNDSLFKKYHYIDNKGNSNVWTQYLSILNRIFIEENKDKKIEEEYTISFDKEQCKEMVYKTILLLSQTTRFQYLREHYNKFPQLVFYLHYLKFLDTKNEIDIEKDLEDINTWAEKYKHDDNSFENPINMYKNAMKQIQRGEVNIFVAMPYYSKDCIKQFNLNYKKVIEEIIKKKPKLNNRLNLFPIMEHTGETKNILSYIDDCIDKCQIFIADVSDDPAKNNIVNPNVMYELGVARQKGKHCIIIRNADNNTELIFDIKPMSIYPLKFENPDVNFVPEMITHIENIIDKYYIS